MPPYIPDDIYLRASRAPSLASSGGRMPIGLGLGMLISGLIGGGTSLIGAKMQSNAASRAQKAQDYWTQQALEWEKERDARDYKQYLRELERGWRYEDEDRGRRIRFEDERETRLAPFRANASLGYQTLSSLLFDPSAQMASPNPYGIRRQKLSDLME